MLAAQVLSASPIAASEYWGRLVARIENHKYTIEQAFRECFYIVPDYQREYVWGEKQVMQLLSDIHEQFDGARSDSEYFIGTVLVSPGEPKGHFEVIDGQQRLTTFFLILVALRARLVNEPAHRKLLDDLMAATYTSGASIRTQLKLDPRYENAGDVLRAIVDADGNPATVLEAVKATGIGSFGSLENLIEAYRVIWVYLQSNLPTDEDLKAFWGHLANDVVFIQISTDVGGALKIFETINERGVGLNPMDLLKNLLFTQVKPDQFSDLKDRWKKVTGPLDKNNEKPLRFLRYFVMASYPVEGDSIVHEDEIYDWFTDPANAELVGYQSEPAQFIEKLAGATNSYVGFRDGLGNDGRPSKAMQRLRKLTGGAFSLHYVLLLAALSLERDNFEYLVSQLENFLFSYIFTKSPTKALERDFSRWADQMRQIAAVSAPQDQREKLEAFVQGNFAAGIEEKADELEDALRRYSTSSMQRYRTKYMLAAITEYVDLAYKGSKAKGDLDGYWPLELEHILPNTPEQELRGAWENENPDAPYDEFKERLGNFILLEKPINIVVGRGFFEEKAPEYCKSGNYLARSLVGLEDVGQNSSITRINELLASFDEWNKGSIEEHQEMLIRLAKIVWAV